MPALQKRCTKCHRKKPLRLFGKDKKRKKYRSWCKSCESKKATEWIIQVRRDAIKALGGKCVNCGCTDIRLLEINHIEGGGRKEYRKNSPAFIYRQIRDKEADMSRYNVLCRLCNQLHYIEEILGYKGYTINYLQPRKSSTSQRLPS